MDPIHYADVEFRYDFNLWWLRFDPVSIKVTVSGRMVASSTVDFVDQFRVESRLLMVGNLSVTDGRGESVENGGWVRGGDTLRMFGAHREYYLLGNETVPPDFVHYIVTSRQTGVKYYGDKTSDLDIDIYMDPRYPSMSFKFGLSNISDDNDETPTESELKKDFTVRIDSDMPGSPGELKVYPDPEDIENDEPRNYDNDREVFLSWNPAVDSSSKISMYHISLNRPMSEATTIIDIPSSTTSWSLKGLSEGNNIVYMWAEDAVGNLGKEIFVTVLIDLTPVEFSSFFPLSNKWITSIRPTCSVWINDTLTGVDPETIEYEMSTTGEVGLVGDWQQVKEIYSPEKSLRVVVGGWFRNGKENWIRFRAMDEAGNDYAVSDHYNVWVDSDSPKFRLLSHSQDDYKLDPMQEVRIQIEDPQSGIDASTIEYRYTTRGINKFTPWKPYKDAEDDRKIIFSLKTEFRRGDDNYIQVRARDLAGTPMSSSPYFNIKINTFPVINVVSPTGGDIYFEDDTIVFDATGSYDPDGDDISLSWYVDTPDGLKLLGEGESVMVLAQPEKDLGVGEHTITLRVKDRVGQESIYVFILTIYEVPGEDDKDWIDTDLDGIPDWWEVMYQLDPRVKDSDQDPDGDGFTNLQEWGGRNATHYNPRDPRVHPPEAEDPEEQDTFSPFESEMWPIWALVAVLLLFLLVTVLVVRSKKNKAVRRIKSVKTMRRIMPSVSWDQITATTQMVPSIPGLAPAFVTPALPTAGPAGAPEPALPPAPESVPQQAPAVVPAPVIPYPSPAPSPAPATPEPAPRPAPVPTVGAPPPEQQTQ